MFGLGSAISMGEFAVNPTPSQGITTSLDIVFGGVGMTAAWPLSLIYFGDNILYKTSPGYKNFSDQGRAAREYEIRAFQNPSNFLPPPGCFAKGTKVYTNNGLVAIENLSTNDSVYSFNEASLNIELKKVTKTYNVKSNAFYIVSACQENIHVTGEHPFYTLERGWVKVKDLKIGETLSTVDKKAIKVYNIDKYEAVIYVYNIEVEGNHNYYITRNKILVHNK